MGLWSRLVIVFMVVLLASGISVAEKVGGDEDTYNGDRRGSPIGSTAVASNIVVDKTEDGGTVTVSEYDNNGLWHRIKKFFTQIMNHEDSLLSGTGPRHGAGGSVTITDENNGGTINITIHGNPKLFKRIVELTELIVDYEAARTRETGE